MKRTLMVVSLVLMGCPRAADPQCEELACTEDRLRSIACPDGGCVSATCPPQPTAGQCVSGGSSWLRDDATGGCCEYASSQPYACSGDTSFLAGYTLFESQGQCQAVPECNGYPLGAELPAGDGCNSCTCAFGRFSGGFSLRAMWSCTQRNCFDAGVGKYCGHWQGGCAAGQYCAFVPEDACSDTDAPSVCMEQPTSCAADDAPVCGCNGNEYANRCEAARAGTGIRTLGACRNRESCTSSSDCAADEYCVARFPSRVCVKRPLSCVNEFTLVCGKDGVEYGNACLAAQAGVDVRNRGLCKATCDGNSECASDEYCSACSGGACLPRFDNNVACMEEIVCGCDGQSYYCPEAAAGRVGIAHPGYCE